MRPDRIDTEARGWVPAGSVAASGTPFLVAALITVLWAGLSIRRPEITYHLGPLLAAASWPVAYRRVRGRCSWAAAALVVTASLALTAASALALHLGDALLGPALIGGSAFVEALLAAGAGSLYGLRVLTRRHGGLLVAVGGD